MTATAASRDIPEEWVPVDRRWLGLDRRTIAPALLVFVWALLMGAVVPAVTEMVPAKNAAIAQGDTIDLNGGVRFTPAPGWELVDGVVSSGVPNAGPPSSAALTKGAITFQVKTAPFTGSPAELLARLGSTTPMDVDAAQEVVTDSGQRGVIARLQSGANDGAVATFVIDGTGTEIVVVGPTALTHGPTNDVAGMIRSFGEK